MISDMHAAVNWRMQEASRIWIILSNFRLPMSEPSNTRLACTCAVSRLEEAAYHLRMQALAEHHLLV